MCVCVCVSSVFIVCVVLCVKKGVTIMKGLPLLLTSAVYKMAYISAKNKSLDLKFSQMICITLESLWWSLLSKWKRITLNAPTTPPLGGTKWARLHDILNALAQFLRQIITLPNALRTPPNAPGSAFGKWPSVATPLFSVFFPYFAAADSQSLSDTQTHTETHWGRDRSA